MPPKRTAAATATPTATKSLSSGPKTLTANSSVSDIIHHVWQQYVATTPQRTMLLDVFMAFLVLVGGIQFIYCVVAGNYPFNAFLSGFCAAVGQFVLTASLRMQTSSSPSQGSGKTSAKGGKSADGVSHERAFADYIFGSLILHFFCINFIN
ncbi:DAD/Ost2 [Aspergillus pseudonomiae]|uniref:Dolichyl-diphosphooligosaccharide--protein glycosyltransferase subunit OST2 n=1 Tax=Aspergillus pseudonomiae TaxID=1506151 RepID=A0A5N6I842_9EURO|nr:DAD/Ost2 [Aspergillus pseudonomiae]KAB8261910.1 DAD/Ost2 [Aspergillus pseudonomiae]KAE8399916.1 DAD/Ost2 [Aspergillus pseudonomiae]